MSKYDKWYIIGKLLCSTFRICKKIQICKKICYKIQLYTKMFAKKECPKFIKYTFWKSSWPCHAMTYSLKYIFGRSPAPLPPPIFSTKNRTGDGNVLWLRTPRTERNRMMVLRLRTERDGTGRNRNRTVRLKKRNENGTI